VSEKDNTGRELLVSLDESGRIRNITLAKGDVWTSFLRDLLPVQTGDRQKEYLKSLSGGLFGLPRGQNELNHDQVLKVFKMNALRATDFPGALLRLGHPLKIER